MALFETDARLADVCSSGVKRTSLKNAPRTAFSRAAEKRPQGLGAYWGRPFQPPATQKQAANGQPNYRNSVDRSELVRSTSVGGDFHIRLRCRLHPYWPAAQMFGVLQGSRRA